MSWHLLWFLLLSSNIFHPDCLKDDGQPWQASEHPKLPQKREVSEEKNPVLLRQGINNQFRDINKAPEFNHNIMGRWNPYLIITHASLSLTCLCQMFFPFKNNILAILSSAGAGSGEFHLYRKMRRKEQEREEVNWLKNLNICLWKTLASCCLVDNDQISLVHFDLNSRCSHTEDTEMTPM